MYPMRTIRQAAGSQIFTFYSISLTLGANVLRGTKTASQPAVQTVLAPASKPMVAGEER